MQVSWIEPEDIASLAESLRPSNRPAPAKPEPAELPAPPVEPLVSDEPAPAAQAQSAVSAPDLAAFRERLQFIREKAIRAGLMNSPGAQPEPPPAATAAAETGYTPEPPAQKTGDAPPSPEAWQEEASEPAPYAQESDPTDDDAPPAPWTPEPDSGTMSEASDPQTSGSAGSNTASLPPELSHEEPLASPAPLSFAAEEGSPPLPAYQAAPEPPVNQEAQYLVAPGASVKDRLESYARWAEQTWGPAELLIVDEFGDLLWGPPRRSGLVLSTMMAWNAAIRASAQAASGMGEIRQQLLPAGESLSLIPCPTRLGMLQIALVKQHTPAESETNSLRATLAGVMNLH